MPSSLSTCSTLLESWLRLLVRKPRSARYLSHSDRLGSIGKYEGNKTNFTIRILISFIMTYGSFMLFTGYAFYVWATAPTFGISPECNNEIKYIFFFRSVRATVGWLRKLWMAGLGATLGLLILVPFAGFLCLCFLGTAGGGRSSIRENSLKLSKPLCVQSFFSNFLSDVSFPGPQFMAL